MSDTVTAFLDAMANAGIAPAEPINPVAGKLIRFRAQGDAKGRRNGWAILHLDGATPCGAFGNWRTGASHTWRAGDHSRVLTRTERRALVDAARRREAERNREIARAADFARTIWMNAGPASPVHPYLVRKGLFPHGLRQRGNDLLVPLVDATALLWNLQRITRDGTKLFQREARVKGLFWPCGVWVANGRPANGPLVVAEGWATAAAIHEATGLGVAAAMNAGNLATVAIALREAFPSRRIVIAADWDGVGGGVGVEAATKAARAIGAGLAVPVGPASNYDSPALKIDFADIPRAEAAARIKSALVKGVAT